MAKRSEQGGKKSTSNKNIIQTAGSFVNSRLRIGPKRSKSKKKNKTKPKPFVAQTSRYDQIPVSKEKFEPLVHPLIFAMMTSWFLKESPKETAGYFNWDEETNMIDWCWHDEEAVKTSGHVRYGTAKMRMAWPEEGIPNGQWHTHPNLGTFWSGTDKNGQLEFMDALMPQNPDGYFCFIVIDKFDWHCTKLVWKDGKPLERQNGKAKLNGVTLNAYSAWRGGGTHNYSRPSTYKPPTTTYQPPNPKPLATQNEEKEPKGSVSTYEDGNWFFGKEKPKKVVGVSYKPVDLKGEADEEFNQLFEIFECTKYNWIELYYAITAYYPEDYSDIVSGIISWDWLQEDLEKQQALIEADLLKIENDHPLLDSSEDDEDLLGKSTLGKIEGRKL